MDPKPVVHMKCKRGNDPTTMGQTCESLSAEKLSEDGATFVQYKCTQCGHVWGISVGGTFNI